MARRAKSAKGPIEPDKPPPPAEKPRVPLLRLAEVLGQDRAIATLRASIASGRIHHAWVFYGPDGVGKFTTALAFAGVILDPTSAPDLSGNIEPDPRGRVRQLIADGNHPDLHIITKELARYEAKKTVRDAKLITIPKDVMETHLLGRVTDSGEVITGPVDLASSLPGGLVQKVFIVDEAELMDRLGGPFIVQNKLLKTLEEPPPGTVIILVTSKPERLLPTIRSRAQGVAFAPLSGPAMSKWVKAAGQASPELAGLDEPARRWILKFADGSPGEALMAAKTGLYAWHTAMADMLADLAAGRRGAFPIGLGQTMWELVDGWASARVDAQPNASKDAANRAAARLMFRMAAEPFREKLASGAPEEQARALKAIDLLARAEQEADSSVQLVYVFENWAAQLAEA